VKNRLLDQEIKIKNDHNDTSKKVAAIRVTPSGGGFKMSKCCHRIRILSPEIRLRLRSPVIASFPFQMRLILMPVEMDDSRRNQASN